MTTVTLRLICDCGNEYPTRASFKHYSEFQRLVHDAEIDGWTDAGCSKCSVIKKYTKWSKMLTKQFVEKYTFIDMFDSHTERQDFQNERVENLWGRPQEEHTFSSLGIKGTVNNT